MSDPNEAPPPQVVTTTSFRHIEGSDEWVLTTEQYVVKREPPAQYDWPERLREKCIAAGYGDVLIGQCDVEGLDANKIGFCRQKPHGDGPEIRDTPAIWVILDEIGVPRASASCHWVGLDRQRMTQAQRDAVQGRPYWVCERDRKRT